MPTPNLAPERKLITIRDATEMYSVSARTLRRANAAGELPFRRLNARVVRIAVKDLDALFGLDDAA